MSKIAQKFSPYDLAILFWSERYVHSPASKLGRTSKLRWWNDEFYYYDDGCYHQLADKELKAEIAGFLHTQDVGVRTNFVNAIFLSLQDIARDGVSRDTTLNSWLDGTNGASIVTANNGNISFDDFDDNVMPRLLPHTPKYFTLSKLPYDYDQAADCPKWMKFLDEVMKGRADYILLLQQWCGYLFRPDLREQKFLLCIGDGANGKGVFFEVVQALVGKENCSQVPLSRFDNPFALYSTLGKMLNATNESSHIVEDTAETVLKSFVAADMWTFERKFRDPISATPTVKIMIATNAKPRWNDKTQGIWRRILLVPFDEVFTEERQNKNLAEQLKKELPGILNWAIEGLVSLNKAGGFTEPKKSKELLEEYRRVSDPARAFLMDNYLFSPNGSGVSCTELYKEYKQWCDENGCSAMNSRTFGSHVRRIFPDTDRIRVGGHDSRDRVWMYQGLISVASQASQGNPI